MDIYILKGKAILGEYSENIFLLDNMEEKPKSYVGLGKRIDKAKIDFLAEGTYHGIYEIILNDKDKIPEARKRIKEKVLEYNTKELKKFTLAVESIKQYDLDTEPRIREY